MLCTVHYALRSMAFISARVSRSDARAVTRCDTETRPSVRSAEQRGSVSSDQLIDLAQRLSKISEANNKQSHFRLPSSSAYDKQRLEPLFHSLPR